MWISLYISSENAIALSASTRIQTVVAALLYHSGHAVRETAPIAESVRQYADT